MTLPAGNGVQTPLNLILPIKSWLALKELEAVIHLKTGEMFETADKIGTLHFGRFFDFRDHNQMGFFTAYDGDFKSYMQDFLKYLGPVFNLLMKHTVNPSPLPVEKNADAWMKWTEEHEVEGIGFYSAYPTLTAQDIRARHGVLTGGAEGIQSPLTLALSVKSPAHLAAASQLIAQSLPKMYEAADTIGRVHFARFVPMGTTALVFVSEYDGDLEKHIQDLTMNLGPLFDKIFESVVDPPPTPAQKNAPAFAHWVKAHNIKTWAFYSAYPSLSVQDIRAGAAKAA